MALALVHELLGQLLSQGEIDPFREKLVHERKKAIEAGTIALRLRRGGAIAFYSANLPYRKKKTAFRLMQEVRDELADFEWLTEQRLAAAKRNALRQTYLQSYYPSMRADGIGRAAWWMNDDRLAFERASRMADVTAEQVREVFLRYVAEVEPVKLYVKPRRVPLVVKMFGWLYPVVN